MNKVRAVKYIGSKSEFLKFANNIANALHEKHKIGQASSLVLFIVGTVKGKDIFELLFAQRLPGETLNQTGVRVGILDKSVLTEPILPIQWSVIKKEAFELVFENPHIRIGQALFNVLYENYPELADLVRNTDADPFNANSYSDLRIQRFYDKIVRQPEPEPIVVNEDNIGFVIYNKKINAYLGISDCMVTKLRAAKICHDTICADSELRRVSERWPDNEFYTKDNLEIKTVELSIK